MFGFAALVLSVPAQAAKVKDSRIGTAIIIKRKVTFKFEDCTQEIQRDHNSFQCLISYPGGKPYDLIDFETGRYSLRVQMNETYPAQVSVSPAAQGRLYFHFYVVAQGTGGTAPMPTERLNEENIKAVFDAYAEQRPTVEFYVHTVR